jgi:hypothetical protein
MTPAVAATGEPDAEGALPEAVSAARLVASAVSAADSRARRSRLRRPLSDTLLMLRRKRHHRVTGARVDESGGWHVTQP